jgi:LysR family cys regulon transcriptional activator
MQVGHACPARHALSIRFSTGSSPAGIMAGLLELSHVHELRSGGPLTMTLKQLEFLREIVRQSMNMSAAAIALDTSQPGMSRQIQDLERELGMPLLMRTGNRIIGLTETGSTVLAAAERLLGQAENIRLIAAEARSGSGRLVVATSHLHARYTLLEPFARLRASYPQVELSLLQANPDGIMQLVASGEADIGVGTGEDARLETPPPRVALLVGEPIGRSAIMPVGHALARRKRLTLQALGEEPLIGYGASSPTGRALATAFAAAGIAPRYVVRASDSDVIKTYVAQGLGVGIVPTIAVADARGVSTRVDLVARDVTALLPPAHTTLTVRRDMYLRRHIVEFIRAIAPRWDRAAIQQALEGSLPPATMRFPDSGIAS